mgnify:FL=1
MAVDHLHGGAAMSNGIRSLPRYQHGGPHPEIPRGNYPSIGPTPSWVERVAAQIKSVPRRINRALQPETAEETAALVGASMIPGVGEGIDIADIAAGARTSDLPRIGWGLAGLALPFVAGSALRKIRKGVPNSYGSAGWSGFRKNSLVSPEVYSDHSELFRSVTQDQEHADALEAIMKNNNIDPSSLGDYDWDDVMDGELFDWWPPEAHMGREVQRTLAEHIADNAPSISKDLQPGITALGREARKLPSRIARKWGDIRLPMDEASVARRVDEQEYLELLHGTGRRGRKLEITDDAPLDPDRVFYQTASPAAAEDYGEVIKTYSRAPNQLRFDAEGAPWNDIPLENVRRHMDLDDLVEFDRLVAEYAPKGSVSIDTDNLSHIARRMGYSGFDADRLRDAPYSGSVQWEGALADVPSFVRATLDPGLIRFEGARFDPRDLGKNLPSSGIVGLLGVGAAGAARRNYVERERSNE